MQCITFYWSTDVGISVEISVSVLLCVEEESNSNTCINGIG